MLLKLTNKINKIQLISQSRYSLLGGLIKLDIDIFNIIFINIMTIEAHGRQYMGVL